jgi:hypothetical protein
VTNTIIWICAAMMAVVISLLIAQTIRGLFRGFVTGHVQMGVGRAADRRSEPGRFWWIITQKVLSIVVLTPLAILAILGVVNGLLRLFSA